MYFKEIYYISQLLWINWNIISDGRDCPRNTHLKRIVVNICTTDYIVQQFGVLLRTCV